MRPVSSRCCRCFNWAAVERPRKACRTAPEHNRLLRASIGPRSNDRGKAVHDGGWGDRVGLLQLGRGRTTAERCGAARTSRSFAGFNWAAVERPRKGFRKRDPADGGHGASIGPRSNDRGKQLVQGAINAMSDASIGPRSNDRGKFVCAAGPHVDRHASIGPRSNDRGKFWTSAPMGSKPLSLQLGRGRTTAESGISGLPDDVEVQASIGPRSNDRGKILSVRTAATRSRGFNWAAVERPRKDRACARASWSRLGFNWAAVERPRKAVS